MSSEQPVKWYPSVEELETVGQCASMMNDQMREYVNDLAVEINECEGQILSDHWCDECLERWRKMWRMTTLAKQRQQRIIDNMKREDPDLKRGEGSV
jgi:hypothetical protein